MENKWYYIYKITLLCGELAGKYYYGKHKRRSLKKDPMNDGYYGSGRIVRDYYEKYPFEQGVTAIKEIIEYNDTEEQNSIREFFYIGNKYESDQNCLNLKSGGATYFFSTETKKKMSEAKKGTHLSEEHKQHIQQSLVGREFSEEWRQKLSNAATGKIVTDATKKKMSEAKKGKPAHNKGVPMSENQKEKLRKANTGRKHTEEAKIKISEAGIGRHFSTEAKNKISKANSMPIIMIKPDGTTKRFYGQTEASRQTGIGQSVISMCVNGKTKSDRHGNRWIAEIEKAG